MSYAIDYHPLVESDLERIFIFIADFGGYQPASRILLQIEDMIWNHLATYPNSGSRRDDIVAGLRLKTAAEKAVICFMVDDATGTVRVIAVTYAGQNWRGIARERI
jgi:toxin ParE1/3/4